MTTKMRVTGETISSDDTYSGSKVIKLLEASFNNGKAAGWMEASTKSESELQKKYQEGFNDGKKAAAHFLSRRCGKRYVMSLYYQLNRLQAIEEENAELRKRIKELEQEEG